MDNNDIADLNSNDLDLSGASDEENNLDANDSNNGGQENYDDGDNQGGSEIDNIFNQLSDKDQKSVLKYAQSMANSNEQNEGAKLSGKYINEITNNIMNDEQAPKIRPKRKNKKGKNYNPFNI